MSSSKIFIASSTRSLILAKTLCEQLSTKFCSAVVWQDETNRVASPTIIEKLEQATQEYDFAIILLSQDDIVIESGLNKEHRERLKARDNCIFEAGLFMAAVGRERCFLVSSIPPEDLPTDLGGIILLPFEEPCDPEDYDQCKNKLLSASMKIARKTQQIGPFEGKHLSPKVLLERQKKIKEGGELYEGQVVVTSMQPLDVTYEAALQVRKNISGNIRYVLFIPANGACADRLCQLLQLLLLSGTLADKEEAEDFICRKKYVTEGGDKIIEDLEEICKDGSLKIYFLATAPEIHYCIHNAADAMNAKLYVKRGNEYIQWASGGEAHLFWGHVKESKPDVTNPKPPYAILHGLHGVNLKSGPFYDTLEREFRHYFPGIEDKVMELCLIGSSTKLPLRTPKT